MKLTNEQIYNYAVAIGEIFIDQKLPIKFNFYLQKNKTELLKLATEIEQIRLNTLKTYGTLDEQSNQYIIPPENVEIVRKELFDLFELEQEVEIYQINIDSFPDSLELTQEQMEMLMFMIK